MSRGRPPKLAFGPGDDHIADKATRAANVGIYTVESLSDGIYYFFENDYVTIATKRGSVKMKLSTADTIVNELSDIIRDVRQNRKDGRKPMDARSIGRMLESDFR